MTTPDRPLFLSSAVASFARVSLRQLQYWDETGLIFPKQTRHRRQYTIEKMVLIAVIGQLVRKGVGLNKIRVMANSLCRIVSRKVAERCCLPKMAWLITDGYDLHVAPSMIALALRLELAEHPIVAVPLQNYILRALVEAGEGRLIEPCS